MMQHKQNGYYRPVSALQDLTGVTTGIQSEQHHYVQASRRKEKSHQLCNNIDFFDIHNPFKVLVKKLINIVSDAIQSDDINVDSPDNIKTKLVSGLDEKKHAATMKKSVKDDETMAQMPSGQ